MSSKNTNSIWDIIQVLFAVGIGAVCIYYLKQAFKWIRIEIKAIMSIFKGKDNRWDIKEWMGFTCWLFFAAEGFGRIVLNREINLEWTGILLLYFCLMYGIQNIFNHRSGKIEQITKEESDAGNTKPN